ncbi:MAG TPA: hypothetical protein VGH44_06465 [Candidatus Saccharimonadia bacterium]|jgi:tetratricopeptide (TPR) repeat protein
MPQVGQASRVRRKRYLVIGGFLFAVILLIGGWRGYIIYEDHLASQDFSETQAITEQLESTNKFAKAADQWTALAQRSHSNQYRVRALQNAAADYMTAGNFSAALNSYRNSIAITGITFGEAAGAAMASSQLGQKSQAIGYYQQAIRLMPKNLPGAPFQKAIFEQAISELQKQP